ncbi:MAG: DUF4395 domain-containing protein [Nanoarchaeota archaeon]|nr:DUF4395 domain-containing protein [Nanoarchaeota archaeon]
MKVSKNAFRFCRFGITILIWAGFLLRNKELILVSFLILLLSAILTIKRAPLIVLYSVTLDKLVKSKRVDLDVKGMRFAHTLGSIFSGVCVLLLYLGLKAWGLVLVLAILKTISAFGFCPGEKIYSCMKNGCCSITKK